MARPLSDREILDALGDDALGRLGYTEHQLKKWRQPKRGIPWKERGRIAAAYEKRANIRPLPTDFHQERRVA